MKMNMKKMLALLATALLLCSVLPLSALLPVAAETESVDPNDPSVILYEDFENIADGDLGNGWMNAQKMTATVKEGVGTDGSKGIVCNGPHWARAYKVFSVEPNTKYTISFDFFESTNRGELSVTVRHATEAIDYYCESGLKKTGGKWVHYEGEFTTSNNNQLRLLLQADKAIAKSDKTIDNIIIRKVGAVEPEQIGVLKNTDFEIGSTEGWKVPEGTLAEMVNDAHGGDYAVKVAGGQWQGITQVVTVLPNTQYRMSFYAKRVSGNGPHIAYAMHYSGNGNIASHTVNGTMSEGWVKYTFTFNSGDNNYVLMKLGVEDPGAVFVYDDITFGVDTDMEFDGYLYNGGFETGDLSRWQDVYSESKITDDAHAGSNALHLKGDKWTAVRQSFTVEKNTNYVISFWAKRMAGSDPMAIWLKNGDTNLTDPDGEEIDADYDCGSDWVKIEHRFHSYDYTTIDLLLGINESGNEVIIDEVKVAKEAKPYVAPLTLNTMGVAQNRPATEEKNLIKNGSFEQAEGGQWNDPSFIDGILSIVEDPTTREGNKVLFFNGTNLTVPVWHVFWLDVEPNTEYVFSALAKGPYLSASNAGSATFGVVDPDSQEFLIYPPRENRNSKGTLQLVPPAWDNEWHLRSVSFHTGNKNRIGIAVYGMESQLYLDGLALYKNGDGLVYYNPKNTHSINATTNVEQITCTEENNLVSNFDFSDGAEGWANGEGWDNDFISIRESEYEYGDSLHYKAAEGVGVHYIRWIDVKPNTKYTFSAKLRIAESGAGYLALLDDRITIPGQFLRLEFDQEAFGEEWMQIALNFDSGVYERIGIAVVDMGGEALLDNLRVFEVGTGETVEDSYVEPPVEPDEPADPDEPVKPEDPDKPSPDTGVGTVGTMMALGLVPTSALTAYLMRRKRK